jgi:hypothetical protein
MKKYFFTVILLSLALPMFSDNITPTASPTFYQDLTYTVQTEPIKDWWQGGETRLLALGGIKYVLPDADSVMDLYESGFSSGIFLREKKI